MKKLSTIIMVLVVALASCKKTPEVNLKYVDVERDLVTVGTTTANIQCDYDYIATLKKAYLYYGEGEDEANMTSAEMQVVQKTLYVELTGLKENTTYHYYYEFVNGFNSMRSVLKTFKTEKSPDTPPAITLPTVITAEVTEITANSAKGGGEVTNDGGAEVTECGICWSTNVDPSLNNSHVAAGMGMGAFAAIINGLESNTTYHVRAYAINEKGTAYGLDKEFTTLSDVPVGAINGLFTINENGDQVYFSQGNLQYQASSNTWRFAEHQWDFVGGINYGTGIEYGTVYENGVKCDNSLISSTYEGWIDLFGWGTSGNSHGAVCYQPWSSSTIDSSYYAYGQFDYNLHDQTGMADWGYNVINNGSNTPKMWRTLTADEWVYVKNIRGASTVNGTSNARYVKAKVGNVQGLILFPDNYIHPSSVAQPRGINQGDMGWNGNNYSLSDFELMEQNGAVILPAAGGRSGNTVYLAGIQGGYWSTSYDYLNPSFGAFSSGFNDNLVGGASHDYRSYGCSVRLVQNANP